MPTPRQVAAVTQRDRPFVRCLVRAYARRDTHADVRTDGRVPAVTNFPGSLTRAGVPGTEARGRWCHTSKPGNDAKKENNAQRQPMTREEWIAYHVARAPKITPKQWTETLILLYIRENDDDEGSEQKKAS
jgi:hypothetical protein